MNNNEKRDRMLSVIADWEQSGKSKKAYCTEKGIKEGTFYYWFSLFKEKEVSSSNFISKLLSVSINFSSNARSVCFYEIPHGRGCRQKADPQDSHHLTFHTLYDALVPLVTLCRVDKYHYPC